VERAFFETRKRFTSKNVTDPVERPQAGVTQLIHIYGSVLNLSPLAFRDLFLLTERQRDASPFINSPWYRRFSDDVLAAKHLVFAGFSLRDIDLRRLLGRLPGVQRKTVFIEDPAAPRPTQTRLSHFGKVELIGIQGLAAHFGVERPGVPRQGAQLYQTTSRNSPLSYRFPLVFLVWISSIFSLPAYSII
jgi:hypothetical protein